MEKNQQLPVTTGAKEVLEIPIEQISPDPSQPRKTISEIEDMANSIKGAGNRILQPIALRSIEKGFRIIFGERRYEGGRLLGLKTIPSIIYEGVTDGEALEMQLIENLQRQDIHPIQQAIGFKKLVVERNLNVQEISHRVGKSAYFVRQQLKLTDLTAKWQSIFAKNGISVTTALKICVLPHEAQKSLYDNEVTKDDEQSNHPYISINDHLFRQYSGDLTSVCFDINDTQLDKKTGACSACPFNSAHNSLFPGEEKNPRCNNIACFNNKINLHKQQELAKAKEDPTVVIVYDAYSISDDVKKLKADGIDVYKMGYGEECKQVKLAEKPNWERYMEQAKHSKKSTKQIKEEFKKTEETYAFQREFFEKNLATGKYKKAFIVYSTSGTTGKYIYVELTPKTPAKQTKKQIDDGKATIEDIDNEINRLRARQVRSKELDQEKIHEKITNTIKDQKILEKVPQKVAHTDTILTNFILIELLDFTGREEAQKTIKSPALWNPKDKNKFLETLKNLSRQEVAYLTRKIIMQKYQNCLPTSSGGFMVRLLAESLGTIPIQNFENEQNEIFKKRQANSNRAIVTLEEIRKELKDNSKKTTNKTTTTKKTKPADKTKVTAKSPTKKAA